MTADRPLLGITLMIGFCLLAPMSDAIAKLLGGTIPLWQLLMARFAAQVILLFPLIWLTGRNITMTRRVLRLTIARTLLHIVGIGAMFTSLRFLPLADAVAIAFVMPLIMLLLGRFVLNEEVGHRRLIACGVGFIGTLMVVQPSFALVGWPALLPLVVAVDFALFMLVTRQVARETDPVGLQAIGGLMATAALGAVFLATAGLDVPGIAIVTPSLGDGVLLAGTGVLGTLAHLLMTWSLKYAPSATLAPMQYLEIPFATLIGWLVFFDLPNGLAALGIAITIGAGLYIVFRERAIARAISLAGG